MKLIRIVFTLIICLAVIMLVFSGNNKRGYVELNSVPEHSKKKEISSLNNNKITVGFSIASLQEERWLIDRDIFVTKCNELGADVIVQSANGDARLQIEQCSKLLTQGIDVLVIISQDCKKSSLIVNEANKLNIPVVAYDRLILDSYVDAYISYDNEEIGKLQAKYLVERAPKGNYIVLGGDSADYCSIQIEKGNMEILQPYIDRGDINIIEKQWVKDWNPSVAKTIVENVLMVNKDIKAILAPNDGTAGGGYTGIS